MEEIKHGFIYELRSKSYYGQTIHDPQTRFEKHVNKAKTILMKDVNI